MTRRIARVLACLAVAGLVSSCGLIGSDDSDGRTRLELFQFKPEAVQTFDEIIAAFEREHPDIDVYQNHVPDADTVLRTRLVREDIPDLMTLNAGASWSELASAGVFYDFSAEPVVQQVSPAILEILNDLGTAGDGEVNGVPFANNADGVLYNKDLFARHGVEVPVTWDELLAAARTFRSKGVQPLYATLADAWTTLPAWNGLAGYLPPDQFFERLEQDRATFPDQFRPVAQRFAELFALAQPDKLSRAYEDGNRAFAGGEVAMYLQGSWAIPSIREFEPRFDIGVFPMPAPDGAAPVLVSGVDVAFTMGRDPAKKDAALAFVNYAMRPEVLQAYAEEQSAVPALRDTDIPDPALADLVPYFRRGDLAGFADHYVPPAIPLDAFNQQFLIDGDVNAYLSTLDGEWDKVARRRQ